MPDGKPLITGSIHPLPFSNLSPNDFERLCVWLIERERFDRVDHIGGSGADRGCDILAWRKDSCIAFQCKRVKRFGPSEAKKAIQCAATLIEERLASTFVFVMPCNVSLKTRETAEKHCPDGLCCHFWAGAEFEAKVHRHPDIIQEFFQVPEKPILSTDDRSSLISVLRSRASAVVEGYDQRLRSLKRSSDISGSFIQKELDCIEKVERAKSRFQELYTKHVEAIENREWMLAHELVGQIHSLFNHTNQVLAKSQQLDLESGFLKIQYAEDPANVIPPPLSPSDYLYLADTYTQELPELCMDSRGLLVDRLLFGGWHDESQLDEKISVAGKMHPLQPNPKTEERIVGGGGDERTEMPARKKILLVDSDMQFAHLISVNLERFGYHVVKAFNGSQALAKAENECPDLIIMELVRLGELDGFEVLKRFKATPGTRDVPVVIQTMMSDDLHVSKGFQAGAVCYLTKPINPMELLRFVERIFAEDNAEF